jgi:hypothetical protein
MRKKMANKILLIFILLSVWGAASVTPMAKTIYMKDTDVAQIKINLGRSTILSFPTKPSKVLVNRNIFTIEYIDNDIAITSIDPNAKCNLVVYLQGRRFSFDLITAKSGDEIILIRDAHTKKKRKSNGSRSKSIHSRKH